MTRPPHSTKRPHNCARTQRRHDSNKKSYGAYNLKLQSKLKDVGRNERQSDLQIAELKKDTEVARLQIAEANTRAAEANEKTESEHLARVKLEKTVAWRNLSDAQRSDVSSKLKAFAGERLDIFAYSDEPDAERLAIEIQLALSRSLRSIGESQGLIFSQKPWWSGLEPTSRGSGRKTGRYCDRSRPARCTRSIRDLITARGHRHAGCTPKPGLNLCRRCNDCKPGDVEP
jgi:hypothetical protein